MAVILTQTPTLPFDQAYGPNPVTLSGIPTDPITGVITADKYVLQIYRAGQLIADLRQTPNSQGVAIFDIQNTLQNFVAPSPNSVGMNSMPLNKSSRIIRANTSTSMIVRATVPVKAPRLLMTSILNWS